MPLDTSIYQNVGRVNAAGDIADALNQYTQQKATLAQLAGQQRMQGYQERALQRQEEAYPAQQAQAQRAQMEKVGRDLDLGIASRLQSGIPKEQVMHWAQQAGIEAGLQPKHIEAGIQPMFQITDNNQLIEHYQRSAMPQEYAKAELEAKFRKPAAITPSALSTLIREQEAATGVKMTPQEVNAIYQQGIQKQVTPQQFMQVATGLGGEQSLVTAPRVAGGRPTVTPLGITKPQAIGKGGTPEEKEMMKEQASLSSQQVLDQAEKLFVHPGRGAGTGASSWMGNIPGTEAKGFQANLETFKSQTFLPMVSALKGMGALSDAEGKKITASVGALDPQMPEKEFEESIKETTRFLFNKAKAAGLNVQMPTFAESKARGTPIKDGGAKFLGFE